jgi:predicted glycoside hydrolase/deacetylase ChbG (UPF0249 family)
VIGLRRVIVNADDFGQSTGVNRGVIEAHEHGIVTSASLMVRWPAAHEAVEYARAHPGLSLGLHFDLGEWVYEDETWTPKYRVLPDETQQAVSEEAARQLQTFVELTGRTPDHLDSHQHVHRRQPVLDVMLALSRRLSVPLRQYCDGVAYRGDFYGQSSKGAPEPSWISSRALQTLLAGLPAGTTELSCHPGFADDLDSVYREERGLEVRALCDPAVRTTIQSEGIILTSFDGVLNA